MPTSTTEVDSEHAKSSANRRSGSSSRDRERERAKEREKEHARKNSQGSSMSTRIGRMQEELGYTSPTRGRRGRRRVDKRFKAGRKKINPQDFETFSSSFLIRAVAFINVVSGVIYMIWRWRRTQDVPSVYKWWWWLFFMVEFFLVIAIWIGHTQRLFAVQRVMVTMDDIVKSDPAVGANASVTILCPTAGEKLEVVLKCLLGASSQRPWASPESISNARTPGRGDNLRIIVLDEKRRKDVYMLTSGVHALAVEILMPKPRKILQAEGVPNLTPLAFYDWCHNKRGFGKVHIHKDKNLTKAVAIVKQMDRLIVGGESGDLYLLQRELTAMEGLDEDVERSRNLDDVASLTRGKNLLGDDDVVMQPGFYEAFETDRQVPKMIYYTRKNSGTPKISPKAGNMNAAIFPVDYPLNPPLIGDSNLVVVNDARHQLQPNFLQRTVPYMFEIDKDSGEYKWAQVAFVQTPQRFRVELPNDPLGNHAANQYDVINHGKDGIGGVSSSGQGSLWRVAALKGRTPDGATVANPEDLSLVGHSLGFRSEMLIEDTHTSIDLFRSGWRSVYVNEPGEVLAWCTHQPSNLTWRVKQVLRWHQGAAQLLYNKGLAYTCVGGNFPTMWHRIYAFDQATYYLQAIPGYILLFMPVIYGLTGQPPFNTDITAYLTFFVPFIVTATLPTVISAQWRSVDAHRLTRDEQTWLSTCYVQVYAFFQVTWTKLTQANPENAWVAKVPTWPLTAAFCAQFAALVGAIYWTLHDGFQFYYKNLLSICAGAFLGMFYLWPMVALQWGVSSPSFWFAKMLVYAILGIGVIIIGSIPGIELNLSIKTVE